MHRIRAGAPRGRPYGRQKARLNFSALNYIPIACMRFRRGRRVGDPPELMMIAGTDGMGRE